MIGQTARKTCKYKLKPTLAQVCLLERTLLRCRTSTMRRWASDAKPGACAVFRSRHQRGGRRPGISAARLRGHYDRFRHSPLWAQAGDPQEKCGPCDLGGGVMRVTRALTHIRLCALNDAKVAALHAVAAEFL